MPDDAPGVATWKERTSAFDRVQSVADTVSQPRSASYIASEAHVAENTAREHLERLVEMNILLKRDQAGTTTYEPDPLHTRMQTLRELLETHDQESLIRLKAELQEEIERWQTEYSVESPGELREHAAETEDAATTRDVLETARDWELLRYRLTILEDGIENYTTYNRDARVSAN